MAAVQAVEQAIEYLGKFGYTQEQAYTIISVAPCEMHIGGIVDIPNADRSFYSAPHSRLE